MMNTERYAPRLLGAAFLIVVVTSLSGGLLLSSAVGSGDISDILVNISNNLTMMRISILVEMLTSLGIVSLAALLYSVLNKHNKIIALLALGWWLAEALSLVISKIGATALIPLSLEFVQAGAPEQSFYQSLGEFLYYGVDRQGYTILMWFYCSGGVLWYSLFFKSRVIPRAISLFGLIAVSVALIGVAFQLLGYEVPIFVYLPILPFEVIIGTWLVLRGVKEQQPIAGEASG